MHFAGTGCKVGNFKPEVLFMQVADGLTSTLDKVFECFKCF